MSVTTTRDQSRISSFRGTARGQLTRSPKFRESCTLSQDASISRRRHQPVAKFVPDTQPIASKRPIVELASVHCPRGGLRHLLAAVPCTTHYILGRNTSLVSISPKHSAAVPG